MAENIFNKYIWLVDTIYQAKQITFEEINEHWLRTDMSNGNDIPLRTFHNQRKAIEEMFDINIECNKRGGYYYYIENREDIENGNIRSWLLNTFAVNNLINESHHLKGRIIFEDIPSGQKYLTPIIKSMRDNKRIEITYQSFGKDTPSTFLIEPYCMKVFKKRWYVLGKSVSLNKLMTYSLDRIHQLVPTEQKYKYPKDFNPRLFYKYSYGIITNEDDPIEKVRIKAFGSKCNYLRALPLHSSQEEIETADDCCVFEYLIRVTYDFKQELLSHGNEIEVLSPESLRKDMSSAIKEMSKRYR
jgi:hypothetical protein